MTQDWSPRDWHREWIEEQVGKAEDALREKGLRPHSARHDDQHVVYAIQGNQKVRAAKVTTHERDGRLVSRVRWTAVIRRPDRVLTTEL